MIAMRFVLFLIIFLCGAGFSKWSFSATAQVIPAENTYMLAIGACPPWKEKYKTVCKASVNKITQTFKKKFGIADKNINIVTGNNATYKGVAQGLSWLKDHTDKNSRAIIYINVHGGYEVERSGSKVKPHEFLVLWTDEKPFTWDEALQEKHWMFVSELRDYLDQMKAEKILIVDACHSAAGDADLLEHNPLTPKVNEREAFIFSAKMSENAHVTKDESMVLFSDNLANAIMSGSADLDSAFNVSTEKTEQGAIQFCQDHPEYKKNPEDLCHQTPTKDDPHNFLKQIKFRKN